METLIFLGGVSLFYYLKSSDVQKKKDDKERYYDCCEVSEECDCVSGFSRPDFKQEKFNGFEGDKIRKQIFIFTGIRSDEWPKEVSDYVRLFTNLL